MSTGVYILFSKISISRIVRLPLSGETMYVRTHVMTLIQENEKSIRQAYLKGALKLHPNKGGDAELFKKFKAKYILKKRYIKTT